MIITPENSMKIYYHLIENPPTGPEVPYKKLNPEIYGKNGKHSIAIIRTNDRRQGIKEGLKMVGGSKKLVKEVNGTILIKPNLNTDDSFPRNTNPDTIKFLAEALIDAGFPKNKIVIGEISGRNRGLPTKATMENIGLTRVVNELGLTSKCFEDDDWVTVQVPNSKYWPKGIKIPRSIYEAERIVFTPVMDLHPRTISMTLGMKLGVGIIDAVGREWLHNGENFIEKAVDINLAYSCDLVVMDGMSFYNDRPSSPANLVEPRLIIVGSNRVATDAVSAAVMKYYKTPVMAGKNILDFPTLKLGKKVGLGNPHISNIDIATKNLADDKSFKDLINFVNQECATQGEAS